MSISRRRPIWFAAVPAALLAATMVQAAEPIAFHETNVLGTSLDLSVNTPNQADADAVRRVVLDEVARLSRILSTYDAASDVSKVNATREPVQVAPELIDVLAAYDAWAAKTGNAFSGQLGELKSLWDAAAKANSEPAAAEVQRAAAAVREPLWKIDRDAGTVQRLADRKINVDALGKAYIVDRALAAAKAKGPAVEGILLNIGGDVAATGFGIPGKKIKWTIAAADPANPAENAKPICELRLTDLAVATSGHYARNAAVGDATLSHLIDPRTGRPIEASRAGVASATVFAPDNATANALATSICVVGPEEGLKLVKATPGAECLIALNGGGRVRSDGFKRYEVPNSAGIAQSAIAASPGERFAEAYHVDVAVPVRSNTERENERPYVAVWIEDDQQQHVKTLAVWGNQDRWLKQMDFWSKVYKAQPSLAASVTRATRAAGKYELKWDGTDQLGRPVPQGTYVVWVEVSYEHGARAGKSAAIRCSDGPASVTLDATDAFDATPIAYEKKP